MIPIIEELVEHANEAVVAAGILRAAYNESVQEVNKANQVKRDLKAQLEAAREVQDEAISALRSHIESGIVDNAPQTPAD